MSLKRFEIEDRQRKAFPCAAGVRDRLIQPVVE